MAFNPLDQTGIPVEDQFRNWSEQNVEPYDKRAVDPYTRCRVILMNGIEVESIIFSHQFHRHIDNPEIAEALAMGRRVDKQQQTTVNLLNPGEQSPLETTIGYEQVAVDLTAWLARNEPDPNLKQALDFALLEDFDHLYRYANLYDLLYGGHADEITEHLTEITPGRPTYLHHRDPRDTIRRHYETHTVDPQSRCHVMTITAAEQQTMNYYMNHQPDLVEPIARGLYAEISEVEQEHVTHYESLLDPLDSWIAMWLFHKYNECWLYWAMHQQESDDRIKALWELHLNQEIGQLQVVADIMRRYEGRDPSEMLPPSLPEKPLTFEPNKDYVRQILASQVDLRPDGVDFVTADELPPDHRSTRYREGVNRPSYGEEVIDQAREKNGTEYRDETEGPNPVDDLRAPARA
ncbi:MAG TPA: hypothetical protein VF743_00425 [Acidimicrobiales bacterium]